MNIPMYYYIIGGCALIIVIALKHFSETDMPRTMLWGTFLSLYGAIAVSVGFYMDTTVGINDHNSLDRGSTSYFTNKQDSNFGSPMMAKETKMHNLGLLNVRSCLVTHGSIVFVGGIMMICVSQLGEKIRMTGGYVR